MNGPEPVTLTGRHSRMGLRVEFLSDKKTQGGGAKCIAQCLNGATPGQYQYLSSALFRQEQQIFILLLVNQFNSDLADFILATLQATALSQY